MIRWLLAFVLGVVAFAFSAAGVAVVAGASASNARALGIGALMVWPAVGAVFFLVGYFFVGPALGAPAAFSASERGGTLDFTSRDARGAFKHAGEASTLAVCKCPNRDTLVASCPRHGATERYMRAVHNLGWFIDAYHGRWWIHHPVHGRRGPFDTHPEAVDALHSARKGRAA